MKMSKRKLIAAAAVAASAMAASPSYGDEPYAWLDYVEANADLFVNTGVIAKRGTKVEYTGTYGSPTPSTPNRDILIGASSGGDANEWGLIRDCNLKISLAYKNTTTISTDIEFPPPDDAMLTIVSEVTLDGTGSSISVSGDATGSASGTWNGANLNYPLYLFARNAAGTADKFSRGKCYGLRIWQVPDGGTEYVLVRDFKPFRRAGVVGLYDVVGGRFYHPNASSALVAGNVTEAADPDTTPDAWLDYVEATSAGQYVNTGINDSFGTKVEYTGTYLGNRNTRAVLIGVQKDNNNHRYYIANQGHTIAVDSQPTGVAFTGTDVNSIYKITTEILTDKTGIITITGAGQDAKTKLYAGLGTGTSSAFNLPLYLFCANNNNGTAFPSYGRCYGLKIWQTGRLVRDFIPCMNDNEAGLYDRVSGEIFYSSAADPLVAGNVINEPAARHPDAWLEYIQATTAGQYIDTGVSAKLGTKVEYTGTYLGNTDARSVLIGAQKDNNNTRYLIHNSGHTIANGTSSSVSFTGTDATSVYKLTAAISTDKTATLNITGAATASTTKANNWSASENLSLFLFGANLNGGGVGFPSRGRCFGLKIWQVPDGGSEYVLVRDFRPCLYDGEAALYDTVNGTVHKSRSNTPFVPGPVVSDAAPDSFLEYAETQQINGSPYLNTGIVAKRGTKFEYVGTWCKTTCQSAAGSTVLGGVSGSTSSTEFDYWLGRNANSWMSASKNCNTDIAFPPDANEVFTIISEFLPNTASADSNFRFIAQSDSHSADMTVAGPNYDTELSMFLFCANGENGRSRDADGKCQSVRIWQVPTGGSEYVLVREFRPCVADGVVGFYDKVSQKVFLPSRGFMLPGPQVKKRGFMLIVK